MNPVWNYESWVLRRWPTFREFIWNLQSFPKGLTICYTDTYVLKKHISTYPESNWCLCSSCKLNWFSDLLCIEMFLVPSWISPSCFELGVRSTTFLRQIPEQYLEYLKDVDLISDSPVFQLFELLHHSLGWLDSHCTEQKPFI